MGRVTMELWEILKSDPNYKIFNFDYKFYADGEENAEELKQEFETLFVNHFYFHEIGQETPHRWKHRLKHRLNLKADYWSKLYQSEVESKGINFLLNKDLAESYTREITTDKTTQNKVNGESVQQATQDATGKQTATTKDSATSKESRTSDGTAQATLTASNLTAVNSNDGTNTTTGDQLSTTQSNTTNTTNQNGETLERDNNKETYTLTSQGNIGTTSSAKLLAEYRDVLQSMNEIMLNDLECLFLQVYNY